MPTQDADRDFIADTLPVFISEAQEQIEAFEQLLLELENAPEDSELLGALFRCAHTIKGSAGIFGLDDIVAFTHHVESLLDQLRGGRVALTPALSTLLLEGNDEIRRLVEAAEQPGHATGTGDLTARAALVARLQAAAGAAPESTGSSQDDRGADAHADAAPDGVPRWGLSTRFGLDTFRNGMDPLAILGYLRGLGEVSDVQCDLAAVPALDELDPESCHLDLSLTLATTQNEAAIEAAFSFARDDCALTLQALAPSDGASESPSRTNARVDVPADAPEVPRLGELLVNEGAISRSDLSRALHAQADAAEVGASPRLGELLQAQSGLAPDVVKAALDKQQKQRATSGKGGTEDNRFIRVHADRLDAVINLLGELVIASAGAALKARKTRQRDLIEANLQMARLIEEIRNGTLQLRMVPIGETFARFRRVVRDTAAELGKDVALEITGGETEMDKSVVERITDPLMHLVRNGLDHGLETPAERLAAGKPAQGRLTLAARHEAGGISIQIIDDGRGINRRKVLQRAWERGLVEPGVEPPDAEILQLIFEPGFSTAETITNLSGRGVGMDVVRRNIQALRGTIALHSTEGVGSRIDIRLPLTLAIIDGFLVGVGASRFIFPLETVVEVIENRATAQALDARGRSTVELRGQMLPVVSLSHLYGLDGDTPERSSVVVLKAGERRFGVMVDALLGQHQTVIKPLGRLFGGLRGMAGTSILGNGEVALIFDVHALDELATRPPRLASLAKAGATAHAGTDQTKPMIKKQQEGSPT